MTLVIHTLVIQLGIAAVIAAVGFVLARLAPRTGGALGLALFIFGLYLLWLAIQWNLTPGRLADAKQANLASLWQMIAIGWPPFIWLALLLGVGFEKEYPKGS